MKLWSELNWVSSLDPNNADKLEDLRNKLENYYIFNSDYYKDIASSEQLWLDPSYQPYQAILNSFSDQQRILEIGCGNAAILSHFPELTHKYHGMDFSENLIKRNKTKYPSAQFKKIDDSNNFPFEDQSFDLAFSVFVLEHVIYPARFLDESTRVLKEGGILIILCPDYLGHLWMASQRLGFGPGTGREKLNKGKVIDAFTTGLDSRIRIPLYALCKRIMARFTPKFYINLNPICFEDTFQPDVDAVYLTYEKEVKKYMYDKIEWKDWDLNLKKFCKERRLIFLIGVKK